jgi:hypothetical protein
VSDLEVRLDLDEIIVGRYGVDESPVSLLDMIIERAAAQVVAKLDRDATAYLREKVDGIRDEIIRSHIEPLVQSAIVKSVQPTDHYGNQKGAPTTLAEAITAAAEKYLREDIGDYNKRRPRIAYFINEAVDRTVQRELKEALDSGKEEVKAALRMKGADIIAETIARGAS